MLPTTSKDIPVSPAGIMTSEDSYANENDSTFDLSSLVSVIPIVTVCAALVNLGESIVYKEN